MTTKTSRVDQQLRQLPDLEPPAGAWQRVLKRHAGQSRRNRWTGAWPTLAAAASVAAVAVVMFVDREVPGDVVNESPAVAEVVPEPPTANELERLRSQSLQMEQILRGLPKRPAVVRADTASLIAELEDRIATVDFRLNYARANQQDAPELWQERVELMDQLVRARYVEAGANGL